MNRMQQTILSMCNDIAYGNSWEITINFNVDTLRIDFTCHNSDQKNCYLEVNTPFTQQLIVTLFKNLLALRFGEIVDVPNGDLTKEGVIITNVDFEDETN